MMIDEYFQTLTSFSPRNFQREAIAKLLNHQDILLRAPTGSGKTETAIAPAPFLFAKHLNFNFPNKLIYLAMIRIMVRRLA
jgi:CRISPR-associated endonuclease/helicase Cas3